MKIRNLLFACCLIGGVSVQATSIQYISIGVNGLTCSQCSRSVEMSIRKLDFVDSMVMDLANTEGTVYLKSGATVDLRKVAKAVTNAGFSVRYMRILVDFEEVPKAPCFSIGSDSFQFISNSKIPNSSRAELILIGDEFMPRREVTSLRKQMVEKCLVKNGYYVSAR